MSKVSDEKTEEKAEYKGMKIYGLLFRIDLKD